MDSYLPARKRVRIETIDLTNDDDDHKPTRKRQKIDTIDLTNERALASDTSAQQTQRLPTFDDRVEDFKTHASSNLHHCFASTHQTARWPTPVEPRCNVPRFGEVGSGRETRSEHMSISPARSESRESHDEGDNADEDDDELEIVSEITQAEAEAVQQRFANAIPPGYHVTSSAKTCYDLVVKAGSDLETEDDDFFHTEVVMCNLEGDVCLSGQKLQRHAKVARMNSKGVECLPLLDRPLNEVCVVMKTPAGRLGSTIDSRCWTIIPLHTVRCERRIVFTNHAFPRFSFREEGMPYATAKECNSVRDNGVLVCRRKYVEEVEARRKKVVACQLAPLQQEECDPGKSLPKDVLSQGYGRKSDPSLKAKPKPSSSSPWNHLPTLGSSIVDLTIGDDPPQMRTKKRTWTEIMEEETISPTRKSSSKRETSSFLEETFTQSRKSRRSSSGPKPSTATESKYTFCDVCSGGGLVSRAGVMEGLSLTWFLDNWQTAIDTGKKNFPNARALYMGVEDLASELQIRVDHRADIMHISFPCQGHSRQNRGTNPEQDLRNNILVLCIQQLLEKYRPRRVTLEQTDHILTKNDGFYFRKVINQLERIGYGIRWAVFNMLEYGVPSRRKRLMIVASCPGDRLPDWPSPTHGDGLEPPVTFNEALCEIPEWATSHKLAKHKRLGPHRGKPTADGNKPLEQIIKTSGILANHPDGYWPTMRQQARLMTVPDEHVFEGHCQKDFTTQIGNGVPCEFMRKVLREVIKSLEADDAEKGDSYRRVDLS